MGRKMVDMGSVPDPNTTTKNIDKLKEQFNILGAQVMNKYAFALCSM